MATNNDLKISKEYLKLLCKTAFQEGIYQHQAYNNFNTKHSFKNTEVYKTIKVLRTPEEKLKALLQPQQPILKEREMNLCNISQVWSTYE